MGAKSKKIISDILLERMKDHEFQEITVSEICAWAKLSRSTFYNHFTSKEDVILWTSKKSIEHYLEEYVSVCEDWVEQLVYCFFKASRNHQAYLDTLMNHGLFHLHRLAMLETCFVHKNIVTQRLYLEAPHYMKRFLVRAYVDTVLSFFEEWKRTDFALSLEEITEMYLDIVHHPDPQD